MASLALAGASPWAQVAAPSSGKAESIGDYSAGCIGGAEALPLNGAGFQVMHPGRLRYFGHPDLIAVITRMGEAMQSAQQGPLMIGDLSQPRGGRASGGHASHQSGLDVDIWYWHPKAAQQRQLNERERETTRARSILDGKRGVVRAAHRERVVTMLRAAAADERVERMFVHPIIKRDLCQAEPGERAWLRKVRPWYGHDDHVHVRLHCPAASPECQAQAPVPKGDGCDELDWWFDAKAQADRKQAQKRYQRKVVSGPRWPAACDAVLSARP